MIKKLFFSGKPRQFWRAGLLCWLALSAAFTLRAGELEKPVTVAGMVLFEDLFFKDVEQGMKAAAKANGANFLLANVNSNLQTEERLIDSYIKLGVQAIVLSPADVNKSAVALRRASDKGVKIIAYNDTLNADFLVSTISSSQRQLGASTGELARKYIVDNLGGRANIAILCFDALLPKQSDERVQGFVTTVTQGLPAVHVVTRQSAWEADKAIAAAAGILKDYPDIQMIFAANEGGTVGAQLAVKNTNMGARVKVFGTDASRQEVNMLLASDDVLQAVTGQQPYLMGQSAVEAALKAIKGEAVPRAITVPGIQLSRNQPDQVLRYKARLDAQ